MIELKLTGPCVTCEHLELNVDYFYLMTHKIYKINCIHDQVCGELKKEKESKDET